MQCLLPTCRAAWRVCKISCSSWSLWLTWTSDSRGPRSSLWRWARPGPPPRPWSCPCTGSWPQPPSPARRSPGSCRGSPPGTWSLPSREESSGWTASGAWTARWWSTAVIKKESWVVHAWCKIGDNKNLYRIPILNLWPGTSHQLLLLLDFYKIAVSASQSNIKI